MFRLSCVLLLLILCACNPQPMQPLPTLAPTLVLPSRATWGTIHTVAQTEQAAAPALTVIDGVIITAWIGADDTGVHHDLRLLRGDLLSSVFVLPLPPVRPRHQRLLPAGQDGLHLLWLDARYDAPLESIAQTRLQSAYLRGDASVALGPLSVSENLALRYDAAPNPDGSLWTVWSSEPTAEPTLYARLLDPLGRPQPIQRLLYDADYPTFARAADGTLYLFWRAASTGQLYRGTFAEGVLNDPRPLTISPALASGDLLLTMHAGLDTTHGYLLFNILRADGSVESWLTSGEMSAQTWGAPRRLTLPPQDTAAENTLTWAAPIWPAVQRGTWLLAVQNGTDIGILYIQSDAITDYRGVVPHSPILAPPALYIHDDGRLSLAWSQPTTTGYADLKIITQP